MRLWLCVAVISFALTSQAHAGDVDWSAYIDDKPSAPMKTTFTEKQPDAPAKAQKAKRGAKAKKATKAKRNKAKAKRGAKKRRR